MTEDAGYSLQKAIVSALRGNASVAAQTGGRIYDRVPASVAFPYVSFGPEQELPEHAEGIEGGDIILQIDVWSQSAGRSEAKAVASAVRAALDDAELDLGDNALVCISYEDRRVLTDPDGLTTHIAMTFQATVEQF